MEILRQEVSPPKLLILTLRLIKSIPNHKRNEEINLPSNSSAPKISQQNLLPHIIVVHDPIHFLLRLAILCRQYQYDFLY
jgi:hypothetical protein